MNIVFCCFAIWILIFYFSFFFRLFTILKFFETFQFFWHFNFKSHCSIVQNLVLLIMKWNEDAHCRFVKLQNIFTLFLNFEFLPFDAESLRKFKRQKGSHTLEILSKKVFLEWKIYERSTKQINSTLDISLKIKRFYE